MVSPKGYAAYAYGSAKIDSIITFSSATCARRHQQLRKPGGINAAGRTSSAATCSRFWVHNGYPADPTVNTDYAYDTTKLPAVLYPLDSDRYVTGHDPAHPGGDVWAADAAIEIMRNEANWNGIFVTLPGRRQGGAHVGRRDRPGSDRCRR